MRYANRTDSNHAEIRDALRKVPGVYVQDVSMHSGFGADLLVRYQDRPPVFIEVKSGPRDKLRDSERRLSEKLSGYWHRVESFDDALTALGISAERAPF